MFDSSIYLQFCAIAKSPSVIYYTLKHEFLFYVILILPRAGVKSVKPGGWGVVSVT